MILLGQMTKIIALKKDELVLAEPREELNDLGQENWH